MHHHKEWYKWPFYFYYNFNPYLVAIVGSYKIIKNKTLQKITTKQNQAELFPTFLGPAVLRPKFLHFFSFIPSSLFSVSLSLSLNRHIITPLPQTRSPKTNVDWSHFMNQNTHFLNKIRFDD